MSQGAVALVEERITNACERGGRLRSSVLLNMVAKTQPLSAIERCAHECALRNVPVVWGENYVSEALEKFIELPSTLSRIPRHFIGTVQSNKIASLVASFDVIETIGSLRHLHALEREWGKETRRCSSFFLQVNVSDDTAKHGFSMNQVNDVVARLSPILKGAFQGLFTITQWHDVAEEVRPEYAAMRNLHRCLEEMLDRPLALSMGMSRDFEIAIEEGATIVRVGTLLFGERK